MSTLATFGVPLVSRQVSHEAGLAFVRALSAHVGEAFEFEVAASYSELADYLAEGRIHFAWLPPLDAMHLAEHSGAEILLQAVRGTEGTYQSLLFVRPDSPIQAIQDVEGRSFAFVHRRSASGYAVAAAGLQALNLHPAQPIHFLGSHEAVARAVAEGKAEVGATFGVLTSHGDSVEILDAGWRRVLGDTPMEMRLLHAFGPIPTDGICAWPGTSRQVRAAVVQAVLAMSRDPAEARLLDDLFGTSRFAVPGSSRG